MKISRARSTGPSLLFTLFVFTVLLALCAVSKVHAAAVGSCEQLFEARVKPAAAKPKKILVPVATTFESTAISLLRDLELHSEQILGQFTKTGRELKPEQTTKLRQLANLSSRYQSDIAPLIKSIDENAVLRLHEDAADMQQLIDEEQRDLKIQLRENLGRLRPLLVELLQVSGNTAIIEITPSEVGTFHESELAALVRMYSKYAKKKGWSVTVMDETFHNNALRTTTLKIEGPEAYRLLSFDRGNHRFIRSGETSALRYTRYAMVNVYRPPQAREFKINLDEIKIVTTRSSGPGGQHVNKTDSAVQATHTPTGIFTKASSDRSQLENRRIAIELLTAKLFRKFQAQQNAEIRKHKNEGRTNEHIASPWTRTYDWTSDSLFADRTTNGDLDPLLIPFQEAALVLQMDKFIQEIETGRVDLLR